MSNRYTETQSLYDIIGKEYKDKIIEQSAVMPHTVKDLVASLSIKNYVKDLTIQEAIDLYLILNGNASDDNIVDFAYKVFKRV